MEKYCPRCKTTKDVIYFGKKGNGLQSYCKKCHSDYENKRIKNKPPKDSSTKVCPKCGETKSINLFNTRYSGRYSSSYCRECNTLYMREYRSSVEGSVITHAGNLRLNGIPYEWYERALERQKGFCAICGDPPSSKRKYLCADHNHETLQFRGLLCDNCNKGLGFFRDNTKFLKSAIEYLARWED